MSQDISHKSQDDLTNLLQKIQHNLVHDVDDFDDQLRQLRGVLNETLGGLPFKIAIVLVVFLNFLYTFYDAFFATRITSMITSECYCDLTDKIFYRTVMMSSVIFWILFLFVYGAYYTCGRQHVVCACHNEINTDLKTDKYVSKTHEDLVKLLDVLEKKEKKFQAQLRELVTTKFLDDEHCESIQQHYYSTSLYWTKTDTDSSGDPSHKQDDTQKSSSQGSSEPVQTPGQANTTASHDTHMMQVDIEFMPDNIVESGQIANGQNNTVQAGESRPANNGENAMESGNGQSNNTGSEQISPGSRSDGGGDELGQVTTFDKKSTQEPQTAKTLSRRWYCFMFIKVSLILLRFVFRLLIVPLLQLQLFNDYAWYCLLNNIVRDYCATQTNKYYIGLDHSMVNYCVYILLLIALLFSFLINWLPKGVPQVVLLYKARRIMVNKKGQLKSQFGYKKFENESDTD